MSESSIAIAARLLGKGVRFRYLKRTGNPGKVQAASIEVTHRCIARCIMCNIWKIPRDVPRISTAKWLQVLSSPLFSDLRELDVTGGEPFLKKDLFDLLAGVAELKKTNLKALRSVAVTTNGLLTERVLGETEKIVRELKRRDIELVMVCAMDAVGSIHDQIRNYPDAWLKVNETIEGLIRLRERHPLIIGLKTTVLPINAAELGKIADYAAARDLFTIISPCIITEGRYLNEDSRRNLPSSPENIQEMIDFYQGEAFQWSYHRKVCFSTSGTEWQANRVLADSIIFLCAAAETSIRALWSASVRVTSMKRRWKTSSAPKPAKRIAEKWAPFRNV